MTSEPVVGVVFGRPVEGKTNLSYICLPFHSPTQASQLTRTWSYYRLSLPLNHLPQCVVLHFTNSTRGQWKSSLANIKKIFCRNDLWSKISHVQLCSLKRFHHKFTTTTSCFKGAGNNFSFVESQTVDSSIRQIDRFKNSSRL